MGLPTRAPLYDKQGNYNGWDVTWDNTNPDVKFFDALYPEVMKKYHGDSDRVFAMGHSNGGFFVYILWALRPTLFAGIGSFEAVCTKPRTLTPKPFFVSVGDEDQMVPPRAQMFSLKGVERVNGSQAAGTAFGEKGLLFPGTQPLVLWGYHGTHAFPKDAVPSLVKFFQSQHR
jgi:polyhydroxybutyrate depolymerase